MEFITFVETNHKENETFVFYLQWTGNEEPLTWLHNTVHRALCDNMGGDYSSFQMNIEVKIPEEMVDIHCRLDYGSYASMFNKVNGICIMWKIWRRMVDKMDGFQVAKWLDENFYACKINESFYDKLPTYYHTEEDET